MSFKSIVRELKEIKDGFGNMSKRGIEGKHAHSRTRSNITADVSRFQYGMVQQSRWANLPQELLLDVIERLEASETTWPARQHVVACASVCRSWREITREIVKTPEECGRITFPISLKQPGPRDFPIQCFIRRERETSTYQLYLGLTPGPALLGENGKLLFAARKIRKATSTEFVISLVADDFSRASHTYIGKLRSNFLGNNHIRSRGPRRMQCTMHSIRLFNSGRRHCPNTNHILTFPRGAIFSCISSERQGPTCGFQLHKPL